PLVHDRRVAATDRVEHEECPTLPARHVLECRHERAAEPFAPHAAVDEHLGDVGAMALIRVLREPQLRRSSRASPFPAKKDDDDVARGYVAREFSPPRRCILVREWHDEPDRGAVFDRVDEQRREVGDRAHEGALVQLVDSPGRLHRNCGMTSCANAARAAQSYGPARSAMFSCSAPASRYAATVPDGWGAVPRRKPVRDSFAPHSFWNRSWPRRAPASSAPM